MGKCLLLFIFLNCTPVVSCTFLLICNIQTRVLEQASEYKESELLECAYTMVNSVATKTKGTAVFEKYSDAKFMYAAPYVAEYIKRWGFN